MRSYILISCHIKADLTIRIFIFTSASGHCSIPVSGRLASDGTGSFQYVTFSAFEIQTLTFSGDFSVTDSVD